MPTATTEYPLSDLLYRSAALTDASGAVQEAYDTDAYGNTLLFDGPGPDGDWFTDDDSDAHLSECRYVFTGREYDFETEVYFYRARYYHPPLGRFLSRDPLLILDDSNLYMYVRARPAVAIDPRGTSPEDMQKYSNGKGYLFVSIAPQTPGDAKAPAPGHGSEVTVRFYVDPDVKGRSCCSEIRFAQIASSTFKKGATVVSGSNANWHIDDLNSDRPPYYKMGADDVIWTPTGKGGRLGYAEMSDRPGNDDNSVTDIWQQFETCAVCSNGRDKGTIYGCVDWGHQLQAVATMPSGWFADRYINQTHRGGDQPTTKINMSCAPNSPSQTFLSLMWKKLQRA